MRHSHSHIILYGEVEQDVMTKKSFDLCIRFINKLGVSFKIKGGKLTRFGFRLKLIGLINWILIFFIMGLGL